MAKSFRVNSPNGDTRRLTLRGRNAWLAERLIEVGPTGLTARDCPPGVRLSAHVFNLRQAGLPIEIQRETHQGPFPGWHGRYRLGAKVEPIPA